MNETSGRGLLVRPSRLAPLAPERVRILMQLDPLDVSLPDALAPSIAGLSVELREPTSTKIHAHRRGELLYALTGRFSVETDSGLWMIPPSYAMWIPAGVGHVARAYGWSRAACVFIGAEHDIGLSSDCSLVLVEPLLREVIFRLLGAGDEAMSAERTRRLAAVMSDELGAAPTLQIALPWPRDARLLKLVNAMIDAPSRKIGLNAWAHRIGASERTLTRLFRLETGMTPSRWRQHLHVRLAMQLLAHGRPVGNVAFDLGYDSPSAFISMFKDIAGITPGRFMDREWQV